MAYDAFISYSHAADGLLAPRLQQSLQGFAKPWWRRRALRVFRDETGLSVNPHLWSSITDAMDESEWFVLLASEDAARSPWIEREISYWKQHKDPARILPVVTGGEWVWDSAADNFDRAASTAVPAALAGVFVSEPRHLDLRWAQVEEQLDLRNSRFRGNVADVAAAIRGVPKDDLEGEDVRQHRRTLRWAWGAAVALVLLTMMSAGTAVAAVRNADEAQRNEAAAVAAQDEADANATEADRQATLAVASADEAELQRISAEQNASRAAQNQAEAESQQARAEANATEARDNADQAAANATEAQQNADQAAANATEAQQNADQAAANATEAQQNADLANQATDEANANATKATNLAADLEKSNKELVDTNVNLRRQTSVALSRQLAAGALSNIDDNFDTAMLQAVAANGILPTTEARDSLLRTLLAHPEVRLQFRPERGRAIGAWVSPNGNTIVTRNQDGGGEIWDAATGRLRHQLPVGHIGINAAAFGPDDEVAIVTDSELVIVNTTTGTIRLRIPNLWGLDYDVAFASDGRSVAVQRGLGTSIERWDLSGTPRLVETIRSGAIGKPTFSPDAATFAWAEFDLNGRSSVFIQQLSDGRRIGPLETEGFVSSLTFSHDGQVLESAVSGQLGIWESGAQDAITFWEVDTGSRTVTRPVTTGSIVATGAGLIAVSSATGTLTFEDARTGEPVGRLIAVDPVLQASWIFALSQAFAFTPDRTAIVIVLPHGGVQVTDIYEAERGLGQPAPISMTAQRDGATLSPDGTLIAIDDSYSEGVLSILDVATGSVVCALPVDGRTGEGRFSPAGDVFAFADAWDGSLLHLVDIPGCGLRRVPTNGEIVSGTPAFSPDGRLLATVMASNDNSTVSVRFWDVATATTSVRPPPTLGGDPQAVTYSPDGTLAVAIWGEVSPNQFEPQIELFAPDKPSRILRGYDAAIQFSPDGKWLAASRPDYQNERPDYKEIVVLSMATGTPIGPPLSASRGDSTIDSIAFDVDEGLIVTGDSDGKIRLWDLATLAPIGPVLTSHTAPVTSLAFAAPGQLVSVGHEFFGPSDGEVIGWSLDTQSLLHSACERANRDLTPAEWTQLVGDSLPYNPPCGRFRDP